MSDEEKKALEILKSFEPDDLVECAIYLQAIEKITNLIEKLQKEIEELKEVKWYYEISRVPKDKIKAKIEYYEKIDNPVGKIVLQSLLEKDFPTTITKEELEKRWKE